MRALAKYLRFGKTRSLGRATLLLCLIGHASLVTVTHHHKWSQRASNEAPVSVEANTGRNTGKPVGKSGDACCVSCCLQSAFASSVSPVSIPPDLSAETVLSETVVLNSSSNGVILTLSNRAPPLA